MDLDKNLRQKPLLHFFLSSTKVSETYASKGGLASPLGSGGGGGGGGLVTHTGFHATESRISFGRMELTVPKKPYNFFAVLLCAMNVTYRDRSYSSACRAGQ